MVAVRRNLRLKLQRRVESREALQGNQARDHRRPDRPVQCGGRPATHRRITWTACATFRGQPCTARDERQPDRTTVRSPSLIAGTRTCIIFCPASAGRDLGLAGARPCRPKSPAIVYAEMFGPTTGDRVRLADTDIIIEVEKDFTVYGEEVKFGGGKVIRDGMGQSQVTNRQGAVDTVITNALILDHWGIVKADVGLKDGKVHSHRQGRQSGYPAGRHHHHRPRHRGDRGRGQDPHRRRLRHPYPFHLSAAGGRRADVGRHVAARRRHRTRARHLRHHLHAGAVAYRAHDPGGGCVSGQSRLCRQGQCVASRGAGGNGEGRRLRAQAARGLGHDAGRDRQLPLASPTITTSR